MIDPNASADDKLKKAREYYELTWDAYDECNEERRQWARCHHNTRGHGQWSSGVLAELDRQKRPHFTFNMTAGKTNSFLGMQRDARRTATAKPVGVEDRFLASVIGAVSDRMKEKERSHRTDAAVLRNGAIEGEGDGQLYVSRDKTNPLWIQIEHKHIPPQQVGWDPAAIEHDRSDARFVTIGTWMDKGEFGQKYPDHAAEFDAISKGSLSGDVSMLDHSAAFFPQRSDPDDYSRSRSDKYYFDQRRQMIRVISLEYIWSHKIWYLANNDTGQVKKMDEIRLPGEDGELLKGQELRDYMQQQIDEGFLPTGQIISAPVDDVYWLEFVGSTLLRDIKSPQPYSGFSPEPFIFYLDTETNTPYPPIRNYMDPQFQLNKSYSMAIEMGAQQAKPGVIAEKGAIGDPDEFEEQLQTSGSVAIVEDGGLPLVRDRAVPVASSAAQQRLENDIKLFDRVSGIYPENENTRQSEAALTHQLKDHKARLIHMDPMEAFEDYQIGIERRRVETIIRAMPDSQIESLLGNSDRFQVQRRPDGIMIVELQPDPQNPEAPPQIVNEAKLERLRTLEADVELQASAENTSQQSIELGLMIQLIGAGVPIPPDLMIERGIRSHADQELAKDFAEEQAAASSQAAQQESQRQDLQIQQLLQTEMAKVEESRRSSQADESLDAQKNSQGFLTDILTIWERADEAEKNRFLEQLRASQQSSALQ